MHCQILPNAIYSKSLCFVAAVLGTGIRLPHGLPTALAGEHALAYTYIEAPNAEFAHRFGPDSSKLRSIATGLHERMELVVAQQKNA